jgi:hypothetical protein
MPARGTACLSAAAGKAAPMGIRRDGDWLGRQDSNLGMAESKSAALPLGYAPIRIKSSARDDSGGAQPDQRPRLPGLGAAAITRPASECSAAW